MLYLLKALVYAMFMVSVDYMFYIKSSYSWSRIRSNLSDIYCNMLYKISITSKYLYHTCMDIIIMLIIYEQTYILGINYKDALLKNRY